MSHIMKLWERIVERNPKHGTNISRNQFDFMSKR